MNSYLVFLFVFIFGTLIGSFLNVVILRFNTGKSLDGRSGCFTCAKTLRWYELFPIASYLCLRGRCSGCKSVISIQYPLVEFGNGLIFMFLYIHLLSYWSSLAPIESFFLPLLVSWVLWSALLVIFVYDLRHKIIPDLFSGIFFACSVVLVAIAAYVYGLPMFYHHVATACILGLFFFFLWYISKGRWMGFGDVKLALGIGMYLGVSKGLSAIAFAFWIGAGYAISVATLQYVSATLGTKQLSSSGKHLTMKSEVPFAPFLIIGTLLAFALASDVFHITYFLNV